MVVVEEQEKVGTSRHDVIVGCVWTSPDFLDYVFGKLTLQELIDRKFGYQIKGVSVLDVCFK